ncbi:membrane protein [Tatumella morbirosei]|uniref:Membrane protein n=1 Tax=Tatumella morbirosei TaxID=642227 RepID=A0A095UDT7_9GAMM|nr:diguanylate cyclase [Tatumella morbirosei]KGD72588.1 membrane protein [Tatumella morbirosei]
MDYSSSKKDKTSLIYRLRKVSVINATLILLLCWIFLFSTSLLFIKRYELRNLDLISTILSSSLTASIVFEDTHDAANKIAQSGARGMFSSAVLKTEKNTLIARWNNGTDNNHENWFRHILRNWVFSSPLEMDIIHSNKIIGHLTLTGSISAVADFIKYSIIILLVGVTVVISASLIVSELLHRSIVDSLRNITQLIHNIIEHRDFSRQIPLIEIKEFNVLSGDINKLLSEIHSLQSSLLSENQLLAAKALKDPLTGIFNRSAFVIHLQKLLDSAADKPFVLLFIDSDRFKSINDNWGHSVGDEVLKTISQRLSQFESDNDIVARIGGDEFSMLMTRLTNDSQVQHLIAQISLSIATPMILDSGIIITTSVTIGYAWSHALDTAKDITERADANMYKIKKAHGDQR